MPTPLSILNKVKLLLKLASSPNPNEAENARLKAEELIAKHNITPEELAATEEKEFYGENEKLFVTIGVVGWKQQLCLAIAHYFDCQIVQEQLGGTEGDAQFSYFVYGDDDQVKDTQFVYHAFDKKINNLIDTRCLGRGPIYIDSYCEGVVESIKWNIMMYGIEIPEIKKPLKKTEEKVVGNSQTLATTNAKEEPTENRVDVNTGSLIKNIQAYFKGLDDGKNLSLQDILELEIKNNEAEQFSE